MKEQTTKHPGASRPGYGDLETLVRGRIQDFIQELLEEEVTALLGRAKSARREPVDAPLGWRNGYGKPRGLALTSGTITVQRPRVRGLMAIYTLIDKTSTGHITMTNERHESTSTKGGVDSDHGLGQDSLS